MEKSWMIRTHGNQILGPITRPKLLELLGKNALGPNDEICSGNGFWFFVREEEMLKRYVHGEEQQDFNPISETQDVLTAGGGPRTTPTASKQAVEVEDITAVVKLERSAAGALDEIHLPSNDDLEFPEVAPRGGGKDV